MNDNNAVRPVGHYRPRLSFYHANGKGTGSAVKLELHPAHDEVDGCIMLTLASQLTVGDRRGATPSFATFGWENAVCVKLDFGDLAQILQVFRGECESIADGKGLYHRTNRASTVIRLHHLVEPVPGYMLDLLRKSLGPKEEETRARILFNPAEALGLCEAISGAMAVIGFGIPMLVPSNAVVRPAETKGVRNAFAA